MGIGKAFGFGLLTYAGANFGLYIVATLVTGGDIGVLFSSFELVLLMFLGPAVVIPGQGFFTIGLLIDGFTLYWLFVAVWLLVPPLLGAIVAGKTGEEPKAAFLGWLLVPIICAVGVVVVSYIVGTPAIAVTITAILYGVGNGLMWSGVAALMAGP
ncbi:MAG: hypothetical protein RBG13Loki_3896 [Promethearchaeota archaeon CR_4]|nr:MAG: hypothetical protein RBG13Loki_3896 [Candidatus Lokiarchaeota archaeon CR_4]